MPLTVETVSPKWTLGGIGLMITFTVRALERMGAGFTTLGLESWWVSFIISFTTPTELSVMFRLVRAIALDAPRSLNPTRHGGVTPFPTIFTERDTRVHVRTSDGGNEVSYVEASIDKHFCVLTTLNIPNVDPY